MRRKNIFKLSDDEYSTMLEELETREMESALANWDLYSKEVPFDDEEAYDEWVENKRHIRVEKPLMMINRCERSTE